MSDLENMKDAAGKALGDASEKSNAFVQKQSGWFMANKLYIVGGIAAATLFAIVVFG